MMSDRHTFVCPTDEIAAYIDGELGARRERELDLHIAACQACSEELNQQKQFLLDLDRSLKGEAELEVPSDFAKHVVANAESAVAGLRRPRERYNALFICAGLFLFGLFALGADATRVFESLAVTAEKAGAIGTFFGSIVYSVFLGLATIVRVVAGALKFGEGFLLFLPAIIGGAFLMFVSRRVLRTHRA